MIPEDLRMTVIRLFKELKIVGLIELRGGVMVEPIQNPLLNEEKKAILLSKVYVLERYEYRRFQRYVLSFRTNLCTIITIISLSR